MLQVVKPDIRKYLEIIKREFHVRIDMRCVFVKSREPWSILHGMSSRLTIRSFPLSGSAQSRDRMKVSPHMWLRCGLGVAR